MVEFSLYGYGRQLVWLYLYDRIHSLLRWLPYMVIITVARPHSLHHIWWNSAKWYGSQTSPHGRESFHDYGISVGGSSHMGWIFENFQKKISCMNFCKIFKKKVFLHDCWQQRNTAAPCRPSSPPARPRSSSRTASPRRCGPPWWRSACPSNRSTQKKFFF